MLPFFFLTGPTAYMASFVVTGWPEKLLLAWTAIAVAIVCEGAIKDDRKSVLTALVTIWLLLIVRLVVVE